MWQRLCDVSVVSLRWAFIGIVALCLLGLAIAILTPVFSIVRGADWANDWRALTFGLLILAVTAWCLWNEYGRDELDRWAIRRVRSRRR